MLSFDQKQFILKYKALYKTIGSIKCPYFNNEFVFFNRKGFNHFLRKGRDPRAFEILVKRLCLLPYCKYILTNKNSIIKYRIKRNKDSIYQFWGFTINVNHHLVRLVIRQRNLGRKNFFSLF